MADAGVVMIVNADDYGLTAATNRGIERAHAAGSVTSTSAMVNQAASAEIAGLPARCPDLGVGLHLTMTSGEPICDPGRVRSLTDGDGRLLARQQLLAHLRAGSVAAEDVVRECLAQLSRLQSLGIEPDHWNVHQHIHEYVPLGAWAAGAMAQGDVHLARNPLRLPVGPKYSPKRIAATLRDRRRRPGYEAISSLHRTPDALLDTHPRTWPALVASLPGGVLEALCHPGEAEPWRVDQLRVLLADELRDALASAGVTLATFRVALMD